MRYFCLLLLVGLGHALLAQSGPSRLVRCPDSLCDEQMRVFMVYSGDSVIISCDSMYLVNQVAADNYLRYQRFVRNTAQGPSFEALINLYDRRLSSQNSEYGQMRQQFDQLIGRSVETLDDLERHSDSLDASLLAVNEALELANQNLAQAKATIKQERWNSVGRKLLWGAGGVGLGILIGVLVGNGGQ